MTIACDDRDRDPVDAALEKKLLPGDRDGHQCSDQQDGG